MIRFLWKPFTIKKTWLINHAYRFIVDKPFYYSENNVLNVCVWRSFDHTSLQSIISNGFDFVISMCTTFAGDFNCGTVRMLVAFAGAIRMAGNTSLVLSLITIGIGWTVGSIDEKIELCQIQKLLKSGKRILILKFPEELIVSVLLFIITQVHIVLQRTKAIKFNRVYVLLADHRSTSQQSSIPTAYRSSNFIFRFTFEWNEFTRVACAFSQCMIRLRLCIVFHFWKIDVFVVDYALSTGIIIMIAQPLLFSINCVRTATQKKRMKRDSDEIVREWDSNRKDTINSNRT